MTSKKDIEKLEKAKLLERKGKDTYKLTPRAQRQLGIAKSDKRGK